MTTDGYESDTIEFVRRGNLRYAGQAYELSVLTPGAEGRLGGRAQ